MSTHRRNTAAILGVAVLGLALGLGGTVALGSRGHETAEGGASVSAPGQTPLPAPAGTSPEAAPSVVPVAPAPAAGAAAPQPADPAPPADADGAVDDGNADQGDVGANDVAGEAEGEIPAPPPPALHPPDVEIVPPRFNPNPQPSAEEHEDEGGDENGAIPPAAEEEAEAEPEQEEPELFDIPLRIYIQRAGPGPIWERDSEAACPNMSHREGTWVEFTIAQRPVHEPYEFRATATAGRAEGRARVTREPGELNPKWRLHYSFARGSVRRPQPISYSITVIDAEGNRFTERLEATPGIGHRLYPHDYCPD